MSARHEAFDKIMDFLNMHKRTFNAPYGILEGKIPGKGNGSVICYSVTFGVSRYMDATITVYSTSKIVLNSQGSHTVLNGVYSSVDVLIEALKDRFNLGRKRVVIPPKSGIVSVRFKSSGLVVENGSTADSIRNADYLIRTYGYPLRIDLIGGMDCNYGVLAIWKNTMHLFTGFSWGYSGEGPSGLNEFFRASGVWSGVNAININLKENEHRTVFEPASPSFRFI
jgi:hypothetical protein